MTTSSESSDLSTVDNAQVRRQDLAALRGVLTAARLLSRELNAVLAEDGLREDAWRAMETIAERPGLLMGEVADALTVSNATITRLVNDLVDAGLMFRKVSDGDGRKAAVFLSRSGHERLEVLRALIHARLADGPWRCPRGSEAPTA